LAEIGPKLVRGYYEKEEKALLVVDVKGPAGTGYIFLFLGCYG
jgi:hypothetical protein